MKIAIILPHFYPYVGGAEKMFYDLAKGLIQAGHEVRVVARNIGNEYLGPKVVDGINICYCPWKSMFGHPVPRKKDLEEVIAWCDIVHTSIFTTSPPVSRLARKYHKPALLTVYEARGNKWFWADNFIRATAFYLIEQYTIRQRFNCYHAISDATKADVERYCHRRNVRRIYLANEMDQAHVAKDFSMRQYFGLSMEQKVFLYYGRPGKTKGILVYERAIDKLVKECDSRLLENTSFCFLLGKEPEDLRAAFIRLIEKKGLTNRVIIRDSVTREQLGACIQQADCVVVPSLTEGFGFSALEACQIGSRLIYSDGGSLPEVTFGECKSFRNRDEADLADKLKAVVENREDAFDIIPAKTFTYDEMFGGMIHLYEELVQKC